MSVLRSRYRCRSCDRSIEPEARTWRCDACGGLLDLDGLAVAMPGAGAAVGAGLWRYLAALPVDPASPAWSRATMGEGATPLVPIDPDHPAVLAKVDFAMPTLSFKDRGAVVLLAAAVALGAERVVADSSGNAGTAVAAYAARLGLPARIFVPAGTSPGKLAQVLAHGAELELVAGSRHDVALAAQAALERTGAFYASHVHNPVFVHGVKTALYEIVEQLGGAPDTLVLPAGNGTYVLGAALATDELIALGVIDRRPRIVAVQAVGCAPLAAAWHGVEPPAPTATIAEGIAIAVPPRREQVLEAVRVSGGEIVTVTDDEVRSARTWLAGRGFFVEPTAAVTAAAWRARAHGPDLGTTVVVLCGAGLKAP